MIGKIKDLEERFIYCPQESVEVGSLQNLTQHLCSLRNSIFTIMCH